MPDPAGTGLLSGDLSEPQIPNPNEQLVTALSPLKSAADGVHEITLAMQPEGLGTVKATVVVSPDELVVRLTADSQLGHDALQQGLGDLRQQLADHTGQQATVYLTGDGRGERDGHAPANTTREDSAAGASDQKIQPPRVMSASASTSTPTGGGTLVDLHL
ncbi:MAG TPA: flagellar hook-length control protein FliK [Acidimicrobiales bacterium]|nr:flagellar hook-length control protein FliK [Acidimicrobiales bacterium]